MYDKVPSCNAKKVGSRTTTDVTNNMLQLYYKQLCHYYNCFFTAINLCNLLKRLFL